MPGFLGALAVGRDKALDRQQKDAEKQQAQAFSTLLQGATIRHLNAESDKLAEPDKPHYDSDRGIFVRDDGTTIPLAGVTPRAHEPVMGTPEWEAGEIKKAKIGAKYGYHAPQTSTNVYLPSVDPKTGKTVYTVAPSKGNAAPRQLDIEKPTAGGSAGANVQKNKALLDLMEQGYPEMERLSDKVRPERITAAIKYPNAGNVLLNQDEQNYMANFRNFLAGVLHVESGARLSKDQLNFGLERYAPTMGDTKETKATKLASAKQTLISRRAEFGGDASHGSHTVNDSGGDSDLGAQGKKGTPYKVNGKTFYLPD